MIFCEFSGNKVSFVCYIRCFSYVVAFSGRWETVCLMQQQNCYYVIAGDMLPENLVYVFPICLGGRYYWVSRFNIAINNVR